MTHNSILPKETSNVSTDVNAGQNCVQLWFNETQIRQKYQQRVIQLWRMLMTDQSGCVRRFRVWNPSSIWLRSSFMFSRNLDSPVSHLCITGKFLFDSRVWTTWHRPLVSRPSCQHSDWRSETWSVKSTAELHSLYSQPHKAASRLRSGVFVPAARTTLSSSCRLSWRVEHRSFVTSCGKHRRRSKAHSSEGSLRGKNRRNEEFTWEI